MADSPEAIKKTLKLYFAIGMCLFVGTVLTVAVASFEFLDYGKHGFDTKDMIIGLVIASVKASLVMYFFMHLNHERPLIYLFYALGIVMAFFCMFLIAWSKSDPIQYGNSEKADGFYNADKPATHAHPIE